jgi:cell division septation protein DedD
VKPRETVVTANGSTVPAAAEESLSCATVGPYKDKKKLNALLNELDTDLKQTVLRSDTKVKTTYLVVTDLFDTLKETKETMRSMKTAGFTDIAIMNKSGKYRLALGLYRRQAFARERVESFKNKNYSVHMRPVNKDINTYWADVTYLTESASSLNNVIPESHRSVCDKSNRLSLLK